MNQSPVSKIDHICGNWCPYWNKTARTNEKSRHLPGFYCCALRAVDRPSGQSVFAGATTVAEALTEPLHTTTGVDDLLLTRIERMTVGAYVNVDIFAQRRAHLYDVPTAAGRFYSAVVWMYFRFHGLAFIRY